MGSTDHIPLERVTNSIRNGIEMRKITRSRAQGIEVEFTEGAVGLIAEEGFDPEFGARGP